MENLTNFIQILNEQELRRAEQFYPNSLAKGLVDEYKAIPGRKYIKIVSTGEKWGGQTSAKYFVAPDGNIHKAASWKAASKTIVGNVNDFK